MSSVIDIHSLGLYFSKIYTLAPNPLEAQKYVRTNFQSIFSADSFSKNKHLVVFNKENHGAGIGPVPFVKRLGRLQLQARNQLRLIPTLNPYSCVEFHKWINTATKPLAPRPSFFSFDASLEDDRLQLIPYSTSRAIYCKIYADLTNELIATGRLYLHVFPMGLLILRAAIQPNQATISKINRDQSLSLIEALSPTARSQRWKTHWFDGSAHVLFKQIEEEILSSVLPTRCDSVGKSPWHQSCKVGGRLPIDKVNDRHARELTDPVYFPSYAFESLAIKDVEFAYDSQALSSNYISFNMRGLYYVSERHEKRSTFTRKFMRILKLEEFVRIKAHMYDTLWGILTKEILRLTQLNRDSKASFALKNLARFTEYSHDIPKLHYAMDHHTRLISNKFHRLIYTKISDCYRLDRQRDSIKELLKEYKSETLKWEPVAKKLPLNALMKLFGLFGL